jgi:hypothetical protein
LLQTDLGATLSVTISYDDGKGNAEKVSSSTSSAVKTEALVAGQPNVSLIIGDDLGVDSSNQYSYSSDKPRTPNLDALAASGIVLDNV